MWLAVDLGDGPATELLSATGTPTEICAQAAEAALRFLVPALQRAGTGIRPEGAPLTGRDCQVCGTERRGTLPGVAGA